VAALVVVGITYALGSGHKAPAPAASQGTSAKPAGKPKPHMLAAGRTGQRSAIPWSLVGPGWALAEFSTAQPQAGGPASGSGRYTTYLVDPLGGKYVIGTSSGSAALQLIAWSGDARTALFGPTANNTAANSPANVAAGYRLLHVSTGNFTNLPLPSGVNAVGFTRPEGLNILAVQHKAGKFWLERYSLAGAFSGKVGALPSKHGESWPAGGCGYGCALSSPDGVEDVFGIFGDQMQMFSNSGGRGRKLKVPNSKSCVPLSWWDSSTVLADCLVAGVPDDATRLWLVPENGATPTPLTQAAAAGNGRVVGAWQTGSAVYVTSVTSNRCPGVQSAFAGVGISPASQAGSAGTISIPGTTNNVSTVVATADRRLLVVAQTSCPGTFSLLWFNPSARSAKTVIPAPSNQVGIVAAVPYGNGPTATSATQ
jgi:TolB protein